MRMLGTVQFVRLRHETRLTTTKPSPERQPLTDLVARSKERGLRSVRSGAVPKLVDPP